MNNKYFLNKKFIEIILIIIFIGIIIYFNNIFFIIKPKILYITDDKKFKVEDDGQNIQLFSTKLDDLTHSSISKIDLNIIQIQYIKILLLNFIMKPKIERALIIGIGGATFPNILLQVNPDINLDLVDNNYNMPEIAQKYFNFHPSNKTQFYIDDGIKFLENNNTKYDLIFNDAYSYNFFDDTKEKFNSNYFIQLIKSKLNIDGMYIENFVAVDLKKAINYYLLLKNNFKYIKSYSTNTYFKEDINNIIFMSDSDIFNVKNNPLKYNLNKFGISNDDLFNIYKSE
jgi:spermidine synthase